GSQAAVRDHQRAGGGSRAHAGADLRRAQPVQPDDADRPRSEACARDPLPRGPVEDHRAPAHAVRPGIQRGHADLGVCSVVEGHGRRGCADCRGPVRPDRGRGGADRMKSGFDANVPVRKPRTAIGRVLTELTTEPPAEPPVAPNGAEAAAGAEHVATADPGGPLGARAPERRFAPVNRIQPVLEPAADAAVQPVAVPAEPKPPAPESVKPEPVRVLSARERIAALRERLAATARPPVEEVEPARMAAAVREVIDELRARLDNAIQERTRLAEELEEVRAALARAQAEIERERAARAAAEARAEERARIADEAVAEAEAVAAERDQVLAELAERRRLDEEQAAVLAQVEAALDQRDAEKAALTQELERVRALVAAREAEVADLQS